MNIEEILDMLDELLDKSWSLPLSGGRSVVDDEKIRELLDDIRLNLPTEIKQAKAIVADRADIMANAKREADAIVHRAEDRARALIAQEEIVKAAQQKASEILSQAQSKAKELRSASQEFSDDILRQSEESLAKLLTEIRSTRQAMRVATRPHK
ncbi:MAG TPA: ATPase [Candidatus Fimivivens faecavium]|nr:ATPase [Candidatus Fimivivens faecavium]